MNMKDLWAHLLPARLISPGTYTTSGGAQAAASVIDLVAEQLARGAFIVLDVGIGGITFDGSNNLQFQLQHSDDNSTWSNVAINEVIGLTDTSLSGGIVRAFTAAKAAASLNAISYVGGKRYIKLLPVFNGTHGTGTFVSAYMIGGHTAYQPPAAPIAVAN